MATIFFPFCWIPSFLFYKGRGREDGVGRWGLTGTLIDISLFYLLNEFFLSLELKRHAETILYFDHLHDNKHKQIIRPDLLSQQIHCSNGAFSFPNETSPEEFVSRTIRAIASCVPIVHHFTRNMHVHICEQKISCSFSSARQKNCHRQVNGFDVPLFLSLLCNRAKSLKKIFSIQ